MKYAKEVMDLMGPYPGRHFRMGELVRYVAPQTIGGPDRQRVRNGVLRVLESLAESGHVEIVPAIRRGGFATYAWRKVPHEVVQKCHLECHNSGRSIAP